jgi:hypothetical protein
MHYMDMKQRYMYMVHVGVDLYGGQLVRAGFSPQIGGSTYIRSRPIFEYQFDKQEVDGPVTASSSSQF